MDIYDTYFMMAAIEEQPLFPTFFKDRYFPTNKSLDIFGTSRVFVDFREGNNRLAPFVMPRIGGVSILREGFETFELEPPNIALKRPLTVDHLMSRGFGESLLSKKTPADREAMLLIEDMVELSNRISRREEWMAVETILNNGCVMKHITDREDVAFEEIEARFYKGADNPALYTPAEPWVLGSDSWRKDVRAMAKMLRKRGLPARDLIVSQDIEDFIMRDEWLLKLLDNRNVDIGSIAPRELPDGTTYVATINFSGIRLNLLVHDWTYENETGEEVNLLPEGTVIVTAPDCGHTIYGGVTQMQPDKKFHTIAGARVPKSIVDEDHDTKEVRLTSKPLLAPKRRNPWTVAKDVFK